MKKGAAIGIGISIIVVAIIAGIASLPDKALIENPSFKTSENLQQNEEQKVSVEPVTEEPVNETSDDNVIKVEIQDGIGSGDQ